jgi:arylsulfatase A-like enzyme/tetratricopeptide (TPR) repeat protein
MWLAWRREPQAVLQTGACRGCNVLLITIDTLRLDRVGAFGGRPGLTPTLDALARNGVRFTRAYASAPLTLPSHASILTAVSPPVHGLRANGLFRLGPNLPTLATLLKSAGYRTGAFVGAFVLDARFGLNRGFDVYDDRYGETPLNESSEGAERRAEDVVRPAAAWITNQQSAIGNQQFPWFAWVHLYDPHEPYRAPEPYASQHEPYDAEVAYADAMVGRLLDTLRAANQLDRTVVVVAADHGESLGEHGERTHGVFVYESTMRVPWIVRIPNPESRIPASVDALVRLIDLAPTVLDLIGVEAPSSFEGRSAIGGAALRGDRIAYVEAMDANLTRNWAPLTGIVTRDEKLVDLPIPELYDLRADPVEATNLFAREAERARTLTSLLRGAVADMAARGSSAEKATLGPEARQRLQALGYVASSADPAARTYSDADDPKKLIGPANDLQQAVAAFNGGARADAMARVRAIARQYPRFATAHGMLASMQRETGDLAGAIATLENLARQGLAEQHVLVVLAGYLQQAGNSARAQQILDAVAAAHPDEVEAYNSLGVIYMRRGDHARARAMFRKVLELDPTSARAYQNLAEDELAAREIAPAIDDLRRALDLEPRLWDALYNLALAYDATGQRDGARREAQRFLAEAPPQRYAREIEELRPLAR